MRSAASRAPAVPGRRSCRLTIRRQDVEGRVDSACVELADPARALGRNPFAPRKVRFVAARYNRIGTGGVPSVVKPTTSWLTPKGQSECRTMHEAPESSETIQGLRFITRVMLDRPTCRAYALCMRQRLTGFCRYRPGRRSAPGCSPLPASPAGSHPGRTGHRDSARQPGRPG